MTEPQRGPELLHRLAVCDIGPREIGELEYGGSRSYLVYAVLSSGPCVILPDLTVWNLDITILDLE